jgi:hypothetical protein
VELEKLRERIVGDPFLASNTGKIFQEIKTNMIKEVRMNLIQILRACSSVTIQYLSQVLKESEDKIENIILMGIRQNTMKACIDDIDHVWFLSNLDRLLSGAEDTQHSSQ